MTTPTAAPPIVPVRLVVWAQVAGHMFNYTLADWFVSTRSPEDARTQLAQRLRDLADTVEADDDLEAKLLARPEGPD